MTHDQKLKMVNAMQRYGGGFVQALSECFVRADENNLRRLEQAFPEYVEQYLAMAGIDELRNQPDFGAMTNEEREQWSAIE